jgi:AAA15 family ATPase/GTPase
MLIEFRVSNFRSIGEELVLSMVPDSKLRTGSEYLLKPQGFDKAPLLNSVAIFGANGSGKSNVVKAIATMDYIIAISFKLSSTDALPFDPFLFKEGWTQKPTTFEITFYSKGARYRYGFSYTEHAILEEWLFRKRTSREVCLFERDAQQITLHNPMEKARSITEHTKTNTLFISVCDANNIKEIKDIAQWFNSLNILLDSGLMKRSTTSTRTLLGTSEYSNIINKFLKDSALGFESIFLKDIEAYTDGNADNPDEKLTQIRSKDSKRFFTTHNIYDSDKKVKGQIDLDMRKHESKGTQKLVGLSGPVLFALKEGGVLVVDEMEANMHPVLTRTIIQMFLSSESNPNQAQLIFTTHDTNLLDLNGLRKDQFLFCEKNDWEGTEMYALSDIKNKYKDSKGKESNYLSGYYGAIPRLSPSLLFLISDEQKAKEK